MVLIALGTSVAAQQAGSIRGVVYDRDFQAPLPDVSVQVVETGATTATTEQGDYRIEQLAAGRYTLVFSKDGYVRQVRADVVVSAGQLTDVDVWLAGDFTDMEEYVVQDVMLMGAGTEAALLGLRLDSPALMDSIGADLMARAGASDAASALKLVAGASVQDGKFAVIRGLPDRYVSSQMNGVRLPSADGDKRAVELDQFPSAVIESIQVSKTFTPDQQGDASGGAVDVRLKGVPDESTFSFSAQVSVNSQAYGESGFLTFDGGDRDPQYQSLGQSWNGDVGVSTRNAPTDVKLSAAAGGRHRLDDDVTVGGFVSAFYERDSSFYDDGQNNSYWVADAGGKLVPEKKQITADNEFITALFDVTQASTSEQWGTLGTFGIESPEHALGLVYLYTSVAETKATLARDTRGKSWFFPGYDPNDPFSPGAGKDEVGAAPYVRTETLEYTERTTSTLQLHGRHTLPVDERSLGDSFRLLPPEIDWVVSRSSASLDQPDKRQFGAIWQNSFFEPGLPFLGIPPSFSDPTWHPFRPAANINFGNLQRIWTTIEEDSDQLSVDLRLPFEQWSEEEGALSFGVFQDEVERTFDQDTFSNPGDPGNSFVGGWNQPWSGAFPFEDHPIQASRTDVDYDGEQRLQAWYSMLELPLSHEVSVIGGVRFETTEIGVVNHGEPDATYYQSPALNPVDFSTPGIADVDFEQKDALPSFGLVVEPSEAVTVRAAYSRTVARQTFKEIVPVVQQEFLGGPVFIGNPDLQMSKLQNYDLRVDYAPAEDSLVSASWFRKDIEGAIEYVQVGKDFTFTTPKNYPEGELTGYELEVRQGLGRYLRALDGVAVGANATLIDSRVELPAKETHDFAEPGIELPITSRDMTNAPEYLYNLFVTYDIEQTGTRLAAFYTVQGDTLVAGAGISKGNFVPDVYETEVGTLNASISQRIGEALELRFQAKNLTNPRIEQVYRSDFTGPDVVRTSSTRGREFSLSLSGRF